MERYLRTVLGKGLCDGPPDSPGGAGHKHYLILEIHSNHQPVIIGLKKRIPSDAHHLWTMKRKTGAAFHLPKKW
jgi:hypothetical protein